MVSRMRIAHDQAREQHASHKIESADQLGPQPTECESQNSTSSSQEQLEPKFGLGRPASPTCFGSLRLASVRHVVAQARQPIQVLYFGRSSRLEHGS